MPPSLVMRALALFASFALLAPPMVGAQGQQGSITGRVTDAATGQPIAAAQVAVVGTNLGTQTNTDGQYTIRGVSPGTIQVRLLRLGFGEQRQSAVVTAGQTATLNFQLTALAVTLNPVVTTATGQQRRVEVGNAIAQVDAAQLVETSSVTKVGDLLTSRAAGVLVTPGTQTGAGTRIRIRGTSSLSLTNNPIVVIDGIRVESATGSSSVSVGGTTPSRFDDLNPEEFESIEVVRGPSAATLYGTDAANGVIVITTKKGTAGRPQWSFYTEQTGISDRNEYPTAWHGWRTGTTSGTTSSPSNTVQCFLSQVVAGTCVQDSVTSYNLHNDKDATPYGVGLRQQYGAQLRGGSDVSRYFLHGEWEREDGVTKVPEFEKRWLARNNRTLSARQSNPGLMGRLSGRSNINISLPRNAEVQVNAGYTSQDVYLPRSDDAGVAGIAANTFGGPGFRYNLNPQGDTLFGWRQFTPRDIYQTETTQAVERFIGSLNANWRASDWLSARGNFGLDYTNRLDSQLCRFDNCTNTGTDRLGFKIDNRTNFFVYTVDAGVTATRRLNDAMESKTTAGFQFYRNIFNRNGARGDQLPPGATTVTSGSVPAADETTSESRTLGAFVEQSVSFRDRLFITGAVRSDRNSAFGADFKTVFYPKLSASWIVSEESFFPKANWITQLRLRSAYGASGVQPGTIDAVQFFAASVYRGESGDQPTLVYSSLGNRALKPERSTEFEIGLDGTFFDSRLTTELTYYRKSSKDALISRILPPSIGTGATARLENLGEVKNSGVEALINAQVVRRDRFGWDLTLNASTNSNELVSLGGVPPIVGATQQQREGYPLYGWWSRRLTGYADKNGDGIIRYSADPNVTEITVSDTAEFHGYPLPRREFALTNSIELFKRALRLSAMIDYKGGHLVYNNSERIRCASRFNCEGLINPKAPLFEQARTVMVREHPSRSVAGFFEDGDFIRFRELSLVWSVPRDWTSRTLRGRSMSVTAAVRNLGILWTDYLGVDPEAFGTTGDAPSSFQAFGPPTYFTLRFNLAY
ncbi:MAG TPA: SusC/RagA family TonB-linked outer membrane protein [Gemmatimonadaceae bacterium]|nr:SusC/RagA family TonB-linked outer membrane protein [Gemmatimonadaceae bacterium]